MPEDKSLVRLLCGLCGVRNFAKVIIHPNDPYKKAEFYFKCSNCEASWHTEELREAPPT